MKWTVNKLTGQAYWFITLLVPSFKRLLWADKSLEPDAALELLEHTVLVHNFCDGYSDKELIEIGSLKRLVTIHQTMMESISGEFEDVVGESQSQNRLLKDVYIELCDALALEDLLPAHHAAKRIEEYAYEKGINLDS